MSNRTLLSVALITVLAGASHGNGWDGLGIRPRFPWQEPTATESNCVFLTPPSPNELVPEGVLESLGLKRQAPLQINVDRVYAANFILQNGAYCLALWADPLVPGQQAHFVFDALESGFIRALTNVPAANFRRVRPSGVSCSLERAPALMLFKRNPAEWLTPSMFRFKEPIDIGARVNLRKGRLTVGIRNTSSQPVAGTFRVESSEGTDVMSPGFGFKLAPGETMFRFLPVRNTTTDEPLVTCITTLTAPSAYTRRQHIQCRSGALFRDAGVTIPESVTHAPRTVQCIPTKMPLHGFAVSHKPIVKSMFVQFGDAVLSWKRQSAMNGMKFKGVAIVNGRGVAELDFVSKLNTRGDCLVSFAYTLTAELHDSARGPALVLDIPWRKVSGCMVAAKSDEGYRFGLLDQRFYAPTLDELSGPGVEEWSIIMPDDWCILYLDSSWLTAERAGVGKDAVLRLTIRSRTKWRKPFVPGRAGSIQFFMHLPVGLRRRGAVSGDR